MSVHAPEAIGTSTGPVVVVGLGATGLSVLRHLAPREMRLVVLDAEPSPAAAEQARRIAPAATLHAGPIDAALLRDAQYIVLSPGVPRQTPAIRAALESGVPVIGDISLFLAATDRPVIGITGSNGKSTTTVLAEQCLRAAGIAVLAGGNLGPPALDLLAQGPADIYVLELSSFQLESCEAPRLAAAAILNLSEDHLDRHGSMHDYAAAKARIWPAAGRVVFNADDALVSALAAPYPDAIAFSLDGRSSAPFRCGPHEDGEWLWCGGHPLMPVLELPLAGRHNLANVLAALALIWPWVEVRRHAVREALSHARGLPHRCTHVGARDGVDWYDDSKATNVGAAVAAIEGFTDRRLVVIAGGQGKGQDFSPLAQALVGRARALVLLGVDAAAVAQACSGVCPIHFAEDMDAAVRIAAGHAQPGDVVLLSPACASLDMFRSYSERGQRFAEAAARLGAA
jgi:UDP-N-acetylmuramoylalanine--D-glutamate ligase